MADSTTPAVPTINLPGTTIPVPVGQGVETLQSINPPFRTNAPAWYTPGVWGELGCAVPQPGRYLQTNNQVIYDFVNVCGRTLFNVFWRYNDRKFDRFPTRDCLYEIYQMSVVGRSRLQAALVPDNATPLLPTHASPAPQMFLVYPIPVYGPLGCVQQWLRKFGMLSMSMMADAMQHSDNENSFSLSQQFMNAIYPYIRYLIVDMATKFFGYTFQAAAQTVTANTPGAAPVSADTFALQPSDWSSYNPALYSVSVEATSSRPPMGYTPTDLDLEVIRGLSIESVIPFLQPWPDSQLKYSSGGVWGPTVPAPAAQPAPATNPVVSNPAIFTTGGPPNAAPAAPAAQAAPPSA